MPLACIDEYVDITYWGVEARDSTVTDAALSIKSATRLLPTVDAHIVFPEAKAVPEAKNSLNLDTVQMQGGGGVEI